MLIYCRYHSPHKSSSVAKNNWHAHTEIKANETSLAELFKPSRGNAISKETKILHLTQFYLVFIHQIGS
jgi:hypothetical protein